MAHTFTNLLVHIIFSTKDRVPFIDNEIQPRLFSYMGGIAAETNQKALLINGTCDHVHGLFALKPTIAPSDFVRVLKANSSRWVHETWTNRADFNWQTGFGAFSVSRSGMDDVKQYIAKQEEHHRRITFQEEFVAFLKRHEIEYDQRFIWE
jgi:REP element-mobilizing transposase RayT